jgi:hypothetical protein
MGNVLNVVNRECIGLLSVVANLFIHVSIFIIGFIISLYSCTFLADSALLSNEETKVIT